MHLHLRALLFVAFLLLATGCNCSTSDDGGTQDSGLQSDAGPDGGGKDGGTSDAGVTDGGDDGGLSDGGNDGGMTDGGDDAGPGDAGLDAGPGDAGPSDSGIATDDAGCPLPSGLVLDAADAGFPTLGLRLWLRSDVGVAAYADGGVCRWEDVSGNGNHFVPRLGTNLPFVAPAGIGGHPSMEFIGSGCGMVRGDVLGIGAAAGRTFATITQTADTTNRWESIVQGVTNSAGNYFGIDMNTYMSTPSREGIEVCDNAYQTATPTANVVRTHILSISTFVTGTPLGGALTYQVDGTVQTLTKSGGQGQDVVEDFSGANITGIGTEGGIPVSPFGGAFIGDILVYDRELTSAERTQVETALHARYP
ncbi:MAG: hypothetical protein QM723_03070 [Myxococcaceae bacterium]